MTKTYRCPYHETMQTGACHQCMEDFRNRRPCSDMTVEERAAALESMSPILTIPMRDLQQRIRELTGRPVWTHELGAGGLKRLADEVRSGHPATVADVLDTTLADTPVIVITTD